MLGRVMWLPLSLPSTHRNGTSDASSPSTGLKLTAVVRVERQPSLSLRGGGDEATDGADAMWRQLLFSSEETEASQDLLLLFATKVELLTLSADARGSVEEAAGSIVSLQQQNKALLSELATEASRTALYRRTMQQGVEIMHAARTQRTLWGAQVDAACRVLRI